jgi:hypothetical protein
MSTDRNHTKLELLYANLAQGVENASPEDLLAEAKAEGQNTEQVVSGVRATLLDAVRSFEQRKLHAARHGYRKRSTELRNRRNILPSTPAERLALLMKAARSDERVAKVTARFRDFKDLTDEDVQSALDDLMELGALDGVMQDNQGWDE